MGLEIKSCQPERIVYCDQETPSPKVDSDTIIMAEDAASKEADNTGLVVEKSQVNKLKAELIAEMDNRKKLKAKLKEFDGKIGENRVTQKLCPWTGSIGSIAGMIAGAHFIGFMGILVGASVGALAGAGIACLAGLCDRSITKHKLQKDIYESEQKIMRLEQQLTSV